MDRSRYIKQGKQERLKRISATGHSGRDIFQRSPRILEEFILCRIRPRRRIRKTFQRAAR
ncbi:hypothetical protein X777_11628, partial [Ooceraea biroi]